jgi:hypothetical protein
VMTMPTATSPSPTYSRADTPPSATDNAAGGEQEGDTSRVH